MVNVAHAHSQVCVMANILNVAYLPCRPGASCESSRFFNYRFVRRLQI